MKISLNNQYIELCEMPEGEVAGRVKIKMSALEIHSDNSQYNDNGITWLRQYIEDNLQSAIGMPYVVSWFDEEAQIPSDHGTMSFDDEGNVIFEGVSVGSVQDAYIEDIEIDGTTKTLMITEGYLYSQRYPKFVEWLKNEIASGRVYGSIEINGKGKSKTIEYLDGATNPDGTKKIGRVPTAFDFSGLAILYLTEPADKNSIVFEVNAKEGDNLKKVKDGQTIELNKLNSYDLETLLTRAFNYAMGIRESYYYDDSYYWIHKWYPETSEVVFKNYINAGVYYMTTYKIENETVTIGDIVQVGEDWTPVNKTEPVEVNNNIIKKIIGGKTNMEDLIREKDKKIEELTNQVAETNSKNTELTSKVEELNNKINDLNSTLVEVNKSLEEVKAEKETLSTEVNSLREYKETKETEIKKAEINAYFENEIPKNGFEEAELNTLKEYVEKCDLEGLKKAEADLIVKKFKETNKKSDTETNSKNKEFNFFSTKEEKLDDIEAGKLLFN